MGVLKLKPNVIWFQPLVVWLFYLLVDFMCAWPKDNLESWQKVYEHIAEYPDND